MSVGIALRLQCVSGDANGNVNGTSEDGRTDGASCESRSHWCGGMWGVQEVRCFD
jgi:hypothetical protein